MRFDSSKPISFYSFDDISSDSLDEDNSTSTNCSNDNLIIDVKVKEDKVFESKDEYYESDDSSAFAECDVKFSKKEKDLSVSKLLSQKNKITSLIKNFRVEKSAQGFKNSNSNEFLKHECKRKSDFNFSLSENISLSKKKSLNLKHFNNQFFSSIASKVLKYKNSKVIKRDKDFLLHLYTDAQRRSFEEIRTRLFFGAFGLREDVKVRVVL